MNVLYISELGNLGGGETSLFNTMYQFKHSEFDIIPILLCIEDGRLVEKCNDNNIDTIIYDFKKEFKTKNPLKIIKAAWNIKRIIKQYNIEVVHSNEWKPAVLFSAISKFFMIDCKIFWTCHGQWYSFGKIKRMILDRLIDKIIAVSKAVESNLLNYSISREKITTIPLGIDTSRFESGNGEKVRKELGLNKDQIIFATIGRFQEIKGQKLIVETVKLLKDENIDVKFLLIGDSIFNSDKDDKYKHEVLEMIEKYELKDEILLLGERSDIPDILKAIDALIIPSINESFGMVVIEAFAAGCPVISTPCDGPKEIICNECLGIILKSRDKTNLKNAILDIYNERIDVNSIKRTLEIEKEKYDIKNMCTKYYTLYVRK